MKKLSIIIAFAIFHYQICASEWDSFSYFPPMDVSYHPVSTTSKEAQEAFDKGLVAIYAFNYDEAVRSFDQACSYDPELAMAFWGLALAYDSNLDKTVTPVHASLTRYLCQKAVDLSTHATPHEQAYIQALTKRFSDDPQADKEELRNSYKIAMSDVVSKYPDDLDAATLYAESCMDMLYWDFWKTDGSPYKGTLGIIDLLESVLKRNPWHLGANHYFIHTLEHSPYPERALMSAYRLDSMDLSDWGHLIHTTSHIYLHVGFYDLAIKANEKAVAADKEYIKKYGLEGRYPLKYLAHNLFYLTTAYMWQEQFEPALKNAQELAELVHPYITSASYLEFNQLMPLEIYLYFHKWNEILEQPKPSTDEKSLYLFWTYAQAMAHSALGNEKQALEMHDTFLKQKKVFYGEEHENSFSQQFFALAENILKATFAKVQGHVHDAIQYFEQAMEIQHEIGIFTWYNQVSQSLGAALIDWKRYDEAEKIFRESLTVLPRNGRSLFGLLQSLKLQGKSIYFVECECKQALRSSSKELVLNDL